MNKSLLTLCVTSIAVCASAAYISAPPAGLVNAARDTAQAFSSSTFYNGGEVTFAFDGSADVKNRSIWTSSTQVEIGYDFGEAVTVAAYRLTQTDTKRGPNAFSLEGSDDKENWTSLDAETTSTQDEWNSPRCYALAAPGAYRYYRLLAQGNVTGNAYTELRELELFVKPTTPAVTVASIVKNESGDYEVTVTANGAAASAEVRAYDAKDATVLRKSVASVAIDGGLASGETKTVTLSGLADYMLYALDVETTVDEVETLTTAGAITTGTFAFEVTQQAAEQGNVPGLVTISRTTATSSAIDVWLAYAGTAESGVDYAALPNYVTIPANEMFVTLTVMPKLNVAKNVDTTVTVTQTTGYTGVTPPTATLTIANRELGENICIWNGAADGDGLASTADNWIGGVPTAASTVLLDGSFSTTSMTWDGPAAVASWEQAPDYTGTVTFQMNPNDEFKQLTVSGDVTLNGGNWTHAANSGNSQNAGLSVTVGGNFTIAEDVAINVNGKGFSTYTNSKGTYIAGPGAGGTTDGARHGGQGGHGGNSNLDTSGCYGSYANPITLGSAANKGSAPSKGGGAIHLAVTGNAVVNGSLTANGNGGTVGASGGSVWLTAATLSGSGEISAIGGGTSTSNKGGGGGGRIAVFADTICWTGTMTSHGGTCTNSKNTTGCAGAAGTIYIEEPNDNGYGRMILDNSGWDSGSKAKGVNGAAMLAGGTVCTLTNLTLKTRGRIGLFPNAELKLKSYAGIVSDGNELNAIRFLNGGTLTSETKGEKLVVSKFGYEVYGVQTLAGMMEVATDGKLVVNAYGTTATGLFTIDQLKVNGVKLAAGTYDVETLADTYTNVSGAGSIVVTGKGSGLSIVIK